MTCAFDPDAVESGEVVEFRDLDSESWVRLWNRTTPWGDGLTHVCVEIGARKEMRAAAHEVSVWLGIGELARFFDGLVADFAGWPGVRSWANPDGDLRLDADFRPRGHVRLTWTIGPGRNEADTWRASVVIVVEAGEQLRRLAADVLMFLRLGAR